MKKGMVFDLYQDGKPTKRVMAINNNDVVVLEDLSLILNIDFEHEAGVLLLANILE